MEEKWEFERDEDNDSSVIKYFIDNQKIADCNLYEAYGSELFFDGFLDEKTYDKLIPQDRYLVLNTLFVQRDHRGQGIGNKMMIKVMETIKKEYPNYDRVVLWTNPFSIYMGINYLSIELLKKFYKKFGFKSVDINFILPDAQEEYNGNLMIKKMF